jgi:heat shock protein HslJ
MMFSFVCLAACSAGRKSGKQKNGVEVVSDDIRTDTTDFFNDTYTITRVIDKNELEGRWKVTAMSRPQSPQPEPLTGVTLSIADSAFAGRAPCNSMAGDFLIKGAAIKFTNIITTKMACPALEQETAFLDLLQNKVKVLELQENKLLLKDARGNAVLECEKDM